MEPARTGEGGDKAVTEEVAGRAPRDREIFALSRHLPKPQPSGRPCQAKRALSPLHRTCRAENERLEETGPTSVRSRGQSATCRSTTCRTCGHKPRLFCGCARKHSVASLLGKQYLN